MLNSLYVVCAMFTCHILHGMLKLTLNVCKQELAKQMRNVQLYTYVAVIALRYALPVFIIFTYSYIYDAYIQFTRNIQTEFIMRAR